MISERRSPLASLELLLSPKPGDEKRVRLLLSLTSLAFSSGDLVSEDVADQVSWKITLHCRKKLLYPFMYFMKLLMHCSC